MNFSLMSIACGDASAIMTGLPRWRANASNSSVSLSGVADLCADGTSFFSFGCMNHENAIQLTYSSPGYLLVALVDEFVDRGRACLPDGFEIIGPFLSQDIYDTLPGGEVAPWLFVTLVPGAIELPFDKALQFAGMFVLCDRQTDCERAHAKSRGRSPSTDRAGAPVISSKPMFL